MTAGASTDKNFMTQNKDKPLTGRLNVASSTNIDFRIMKALSKKIKVTINDIVTSALSTAFHQVFKENGD